MAKESKREQILNALDRLLPGRRFHEITLDEVAHEAQVGKGTIYLYFHDKDALFAELICYRMERLQTALQKLENCSSAELPDRVLALVDEFIREHRTGFGAVGDLAAHVARLSPEQHEQLKQHGCNLVDTLTAVMHKAEPTRDAAEVRSYAQILLWLIDGYSRARSGLAGMEVFPEAEFLTAFFRRGAMIED